VMRGFGQAGHENEIGRSLMRLASPKLPEAAKAGSLTTEYPANGSSFQNTHTQCERRGEFTRRGRTVR